MTTWRPKGTYNHLPTQDDGVLERDPTVPAGLYELVEPIAGKDWAASYLTQAIVHGRAIVPRGLVAWDAIRRHRQVCDALAEHGWTMIKPSPKGRPDRAVKRLGFAA